MQAAGRFGIFTAGAMITPLALVTGASRGIGRGIAVELARCGFSVAINYASRGDAAEVCRRLCAAAMPAGCAAESEIFQADVSVGADRQRLLDAVWARFGWIDLLVNNAGVGPRVRRDLLQAEEEEFDRLMQINVKAPFFLSQDVAKRWLEGLHGRPAEARAPAIINISSISAYTPSVNRGEYCLSKAALSMMTRLYASRLADHGINVYEIRPGIIATDMTAPVKGKYDAMIADGLMPIRRWGTPEDVGRAVAAIAEGKLPFSTGEVINVDGGFHMHRL
jgi:3-oxoacyl-[acyl-carrier protein] reductase